MIICIQSNCSLLVVFFIFIIEHYLLIKINQISSIISYIVIYIVVYVLTTIVNVTQIKLRVINYLKCTQKCMNVSPALSIFFRREVMKLDFLIFYFA